MWSYGFAKCLEGKCQSMGLAEDANETLEIKLITGLFGVFVHDTAMDLGRLDVLLEHMRPTLIALHNDWGEDC